MSRNHPEATQVLERARVDFDNTYLWTMIFLKDARIALQRLGILNYFDYLIGLEILEDKRDVYHAVRC